MTNLTLSGAKNCDDPASCLCGGGDSVVSGVVTGVVNATVVATPENDDDEGAALYIILVVFTYRCLRRCGCGCWCIVCAALALAGLLFLMRVLF